MHDSIKNVLIVRAPENTDVAGNERLLLYKAPESNATGSQVYKIENCVLDNWNLVGDLTDAAYIEWTGKATSIKPDTSNFVFSSTLPTQPIKAGLIHYDIDNGNVNIRNTTNDAWIPCITEGTELTDNFVTTKTTKLNITAPGGGSNLVFSREGDLVFSSEADAGLFTGSTNAKIYVASLTGHEYQTVEKYFKTHVPSPFNWVTQFTWVLTLNGTDHTTLGTALATDTSASSPITTLKSSSTEGHNCVFFDVKGNAWLALAVTGSGSLDSVANLNSELSA